MDNNSSLFEHIVDITKNSEKDIIFHQSAFGLEVTIIDLKNKKEIARVVTDSFEPEIELNYHLPIMNRELIKIENA